MPKAMINVFSPSEITRYSRHFALPGFGMEGQKRLKDSSVLIIGAGGLGSPLLQYLAAAGIGTIGIVDFDTVDETNLQRQVLYSVKDLGMLKVEAAKERLSSLNPQIKIKIYPVRLSPENVLDIMKEYQVVADGTDNFPTRYLVNDACVMLGKTNVYASIFRFEGQVAVFNYKNGPDYRDLFPVPPLPGSVPDCAEGGVLGVLPGIIGCLQANEVIKVVAGIGKPLSGKLFLLNALSFETQIITIQKDKNRSPVKSLEWYHEYCGPEMLGNEITPEELWEWKNKNIDFQLIDVREKGENEELSLGGELIPLGTLEQNVEKISRTKKVVVHCRSGRRSAEAINILQSKYGFKNLYNLKGGIMSCRPWGK